MAPVPFRGLAARALVLSTLFALASAPAAHALRLVDYNVTNYPGVLFPQRQPYFRTIFTPLNADIVVCQEFTSQTGVDSFRTNVLNAIEPGQWASATFFNGNDTDNALFYKPANVQVLGSWAFYPDPTTNLRYVTVWRLKPLGYGSDIGFMSFMHRPPLRCLPRLHLRATFNVEIPWLSAFATLDFHVPELPAFFGHGVTSG